MERERPSITQTDHSVPGAKAEAGGQAVNIRLVGFDRPWFTALAVAISIMSAFYSFEAGRQATQDVYWRQRTEAFLEILATQGYRVPPELLHHKE